MKSRFLLVLVLVVGLSTLVLAQTDTARVVGTITDPTGAVVPNATVAVTSAGTGQTVTVKTGGAGEYAINALPVGKYHAEVSQPDSRPKPPTLPLKRRRYWNSA